MTKQVRIRRGTTAQVDEFTGVVGEIVIDTDRSEIRVQNGVAGGLRVPRFGGSFGAAAGSAALPSLFADGDTNTGFYFPAADTVGVSTAGIERFRIDSAGNLGVGVTPSAWRSAERVFEIAGSSGVGNIASGGANLYFVSNAFRNEAGDYIYKDSASNALRYQMLSNGKYIWSRADPGTAGDPITFTQAMTLTQGGNLLVGTTVASTGAFAEFTSTTGALVVPRMTTAQRDAMGAVVNGAVIYNTTTNKMNFREAGAWVQPTVTAA